MGPPRVKNMQINHVMKAWSTNKDTKRKNQVPAQVFLAAFKLN